jgi:GNAT superfamily N-acetyltransferase
LNTASSDRAAIRAISYFDHPREVIMHIVRSRGSASDIADVAGVHLATRRTAYAGLVPAEVLGSMTVEGLAADWADRLRDAPTPHALLLARADDPAGTLHGFCHVGQGDGLGELHAIHVSPDAQGTGVGRLLLAAGLDRLAAWGHRRARLWVLDGNDSAQGFYRAQSWHRVPELRQLTDIGGAAVAQVAYERALTPPGRPGPATSTRTSPSRTT